VHAMANDTKAAVAVHVSAWMVYGDAILCISHGVYVKYGMCMSRVFEKHCCGLVQELGWTKC
jgi:hypothetical protein